jgi:Protein of unknown function (DUF3775)
MAQSETDVLTPQINADKVCFIIAMARELESEDEGIEADASNATDDQFMSALTDEADAPTRRELVGFIGALDEDEKAELVALVWTGRGDYTAREWPGAVAEARSRRETNTAAYLLGMPLLAAYLEEGLAEFDLSCEDFDAKNLDDTQLDEGEGDAA